MKDILHWLLHWLSSIPTVEIGNLDVEIGDHAKYIVSISDRAKHIVTISDHAKSTIALSDRTRGL